MQDSCEQTGEVSIVALTERAPFVPVDGIAMRACWGAGVMVNQLEMEPGTEIPLHSHPEEQLGLILDGQLVLRVGDDERALGPGHAYVVPGGVPHAGRAGADGCRLIDVFQPVRADYRAAQLAAEPSAGG